MKAITVSLLPKLHACIALLACTALVATFGGWLTAPARASAQNPFVSPDLVATPIGALPFTITSPGLYRVTADLTGMSDMDGIRVEANHVTIDLGGFTLSGADGTGTGIEQGLDVSHVTVANGRLTNWARGADIRSEGTVRNVISEMNSEKGFSFSRTYAEACVARNNGSVGIDFSDCVARACRASNNGNTGINAVRSTIEDCVSESLGAFSAFTLSDAVARRCRTSGPGGELGFFVVGGTVVDCFVGGYDVGFDLSSGAIARDCEASLASVAAFRAERSRLEGCTAGGEARNVIELLDYSVAERCTVSQGGAVGIRVGAGSVADRCTVLPQSGPAGGSAIVADEAATVRECRVDAPLVHGIVALGDLVTISHNVVRGAGEAGIVAASHCVVTRNLVSDCSGPAIRTQGDANRFESNTVRKSAIGFFVLGRDNLLFRNDGADNAVEHSIAAGNTRGPLLTDQDWIQGTNPYYNFDLTF